MTYPAFVNPLGGKAAPDIAGIMLHHLAPASLSRVGHLQGNDHSLH